MRLSRKSLGVIGAVAGIGIGGAFIYALQPPAKNVAEELYNTQNHATADGLAGAPKDYSQVPRLGPPLPGDLGRPILNAQARGTDISVPPMGSAASVGSQADAANVARQRMAQERDAARTSRVFLGGGESAAAPTSNPGNVPDGLADLRGLAGAQPVGENGNAASGGADPNGQAAKRAFLNAAADRRTTSDERMTAPVSPNVVQAGSVIPAALITGIRSDLPGQISAQVTQNVYDSVTGRILLIPQGSRLIGDYDSQVSFGQHRVLLAWNRLILPGGRSIVLDRQPGAEAAGFAGLQDGVNYHWGNMAKAALISTVLGIGEEPGSGSDNDLARALRRGSQDTISQTGQQIVSQQLNVPPTLTIRPGFPVRVIVTRDLVLEPIGEAR